MERKNTFSSAAICTALFSLGAVALPASAAVTVTFTHPESYRDMPFSPIDREHILKDLGEYFVKLEKALPPGQDLAIEVLDLDLAGRVLPNFRAGQDLRVMRGGADWPHMKLRYTLSANGKVISSGQEQLSDMAYMDRINIYSSGDNLRYEKRMVDDWFKKKFVAGKRG
jgi:hypothetical protein